MRCGVRLGQETLCFLPQSGAAASMCVDLVALLSSWLPVAEAWGLCLESWQH